jgi:hypothetical protein
MHPNLWVSLSQQHTTKMRTCIMISLRADPSLPFFISWTSSLSTGIPRNKLQSKLLHMEASTSQQEPVSTKSWIYEQHFNTLASQSETWATCLETKNRLSTAPLSHTPSCIIDTMLYPFIMFARPLHLDTLCWLTYLESSTPRISWASIGDTRLLGRSSSLSCSSMEIQQTSFKVKILIRYAFYRNYLLRYMCINFLGNRPQADGEWQKFHSHAYTRAMVCSFVSLTFYLSYLRRWIATKICLWHCLFASFESLSQLIIVIWIKTSVGTTTVFHTGISRAVAAA